MSFKENVNGRRTHDGWRTKTDHNRSPWALGSGELKRQKEFSSVCGTQYIEKGLLLSMFNAICRFQACMLTHIYTVAEHNKLALFIPSQNTMQDRYRPTIEMSFKCRLAGGPIVACWELHGMTCLERYGSWCVTIATNSTLSEKLIVRIAHFQQFKVAM